MTDKTNPPATGATPASNPQKAPLARKPGFDPAALKGGKISGGKGPAPGKKIPLPGKARGR